MDIRCPSCSKLFRVADEKIAGKGIRFKCSKCAEIVTITKDDFEMDLLAREAEATETAPQQAPESATRQSPPTAPQPSIKLVPPLPILSHEPKAREYQPPQEHDVPPAALSDFDFSEPHAAATAAANPAEGFGGQDFSFNVEPDQEAAPEVEITPEATAEAEAALQFPDDLISEPKRKPVFGAPSTGELTDEEVPAPAPKAEIKPEPSMFQEQKPKTGPSSTPPDSRPAPEKQADDEEIDLGAALAMPKGPSAGSDTAAARHEPDHGAAQATPKGPVITPDLLAEMMKRSTAHNKAAAQARSVPHADEDMDLGAALAMPKTSDPARKEVAGADSASLGGSDAPPKGKRALVIGVIAFVLILALAALYLMGFLGGEAEKTAVQKPQHVSQSKPQPARQEIRPEGLSIVDPIAFVDTERGDLVITGKIQNATDKPKAGWYLVTEVRDAKETVLLTVKMVNGIQIYSKADQEALVKRGVKIEEIQKKMASFGEGSIPPKGIVSFEVRVMNPPAGSARFLPMLQSVERSSLVESIKAVQGHP